MRRSIAWRTLLSLGLAGSLAAQALAGPAHSRADTGGASSVPLQHEWHGLTPLTPEQAQALAQDANQRVSIIFKDQFDGLPARGATRTQRVDAISAAQSPLVAELQQVGATNVHAFQLINAIAATVSPAEVDRLKADPAVQAVVPDRFIKAPALSTVNSEQPSAAPDVTPNETGACTNTVSLEPEPLQLTNTAFNNATAQQEQNLTAPGGAKIDGSGVKVAWFAGDIDINNPDFTRNGQSIFADYKDFSGEGTNGPSPADLESFLDASSIAAQGNTIYNVAKSVSAGGAGNFITTPGYNTGACNIRVRGMAPGASLYGFQVFSNANGASDTIIAQAVEYAVLVDNVDILSLSLGSDAVPDDNNDPLRLALDAAVAGGKTVVVSSGDQGTQGTLGTPSTDPNVIEMGASTAYRPYAQIGELGFTLGNGDYVSNNISTISSAGFAQSGGRTIDAVAGGDLGWIVCTPAALYASCRDGLGQPSRVSLVGGTSESAPLAAGEAALIVQAYRSTHGGASPTPALVKSIIKSTATDLGIPAEEQGAGEINSYRAVQAALSYGLDRSDPNRQGNGLVITTPDGTGTLSATDLPGTSEAFPVTITNAGRQVTIVLPQQLNHSGSTVQSLGAPVYNASFTPTLNPATAPTFNDRGLIRPYVEQDFTLPGNGQRLDVAYAFDVTSQPGTRVSATLFDPQGRLTGVTFPNPDGAGFDHFGIRNPQAGTYRLILWTSKSAGLTYSGPIQVSVAESNFTSSGRISPPVLVIGPGASRTFVVRTSTPAQPGDFSGKVVLRTLSIGGAGVGKQAMAIPVVLRSLVPLGATGGSFIGTLTGGNGNGVNQIQTYAFNVPAGQRDLDLNVALADPTYQLYGYLVDPNKTPLNQQSTISSVNPKTGAITGLTNTMQFFRRDPQPGLWRFVLVNNGVSGRQTSIPYTVNVGFNAAFNGVQTSGVPTGATLPYSQATTLKINVTNTGNTTKDYYVDPRLAGYATFALTRTVVVTDPAVQETQGSLPALFFLPTESNNVTVQTRSSAPIRFEAVPAETFTGAPYLSSGRPSPPDASGNYVASASFSAPEVTSSLYDVLPTQVGPFAGPAAPATVAITTFITTQTPDSDATASTGDPVFAGPYAPLTLAPGQSGTITVTIFPTRSSGTVVSGNLYLDASSGNTAAFGGSLVDPVDELVAIPYQYTVGPGNP